MTAENPASQAMEWYSSFHEVTPPILSVGSYETSLGGQHMLRLDWSSYRPYPYHMFTPSDGQEIQAGISLVPQDMLEQYALRQYESMRGMRGILLDIYDENPLCTVMKFGFALGVPEHELVLGAAFEAEVPIDSLMRSGTMSLQMNVFGSYQRFGCTTFHAEGLTEIETFAPVLDVEEKLFVGKSYILMRALTRLLPTAARKAAGDIWSHESDISYTLHLQNRILDEFSQGR